MPLRAGSSSWDPLPLRTPRRKLPTASEHNTLWRIWSSTSCTAQTPRKLLSKRSITFSLQSRRLLSSSQVPSTSKVSLLAASDMSLFLITLLTYVDVLPLVMAHIMQCRLMHIERHCMLSSTHVILLPLHAPVVVFLRAYTGEDS